MCPNCENMRSGHFCNICWGKGNGNRIFRRDDSQPTSTELTASLMGESYLRINRWYLVSLDGKSYNKMLLILRSGQLHMFRDENEKVYNIHTSEIKGVKLDEEAII
jgi:hypothetical protein